MSYNVFDLNYDRNLIRAGAYPEENLETRNAFNEGVAPDTMLSGGLGGNITIVDGYLKSDNFVDGVSGWQLTPTSAQLPDLTIVGGTIKYQKDSFTDDTKSGYYIGSEGLYVGSASDTTKLKYSLDTGTFDFVGTVSGRSTATLASAINSDGNLVKEVINTKLDTSAEQILADFTFGESGAIKMITDEDNGLWISPTGILAKKSGNTTLTITNTGNATFAGTLSAAAGTLGTITLTSGGHIKLGQTAYNTGTGFWLGDDSGTAKLSIGSSTKNITWDGSNLKVQGGTITGSTLTTGTTGNNIDLTAGRLSQRNDTTEVAYSDVGTYGGWFGIKDMDGNSVCAWYVRDADGHTALMNENNLYIQADNIIAAIGTGYLYPGENNKAYCGVTSNAWNTVTAYNFADLCSMYDEIDDIAIIKGIKAKKGEFDEYGFPKMDLDSLPRFIQHHDAESKKTFRNLGRVVDLCLGAIKQEDDKIIALERRIAQLENIIDRQK